MTRSTAAFVLALSTSAFACVTAPAPEDLLGESSAEVRGGSKAGSTTTAPAPAPATEPAPAPAYGLLPSASLTSTSTLPAAQDSFVGSKTRNIFFYGLVWSAPGTHAVTVDLFAPSGALYAHKSYSLDYEAAPIDAASAAHWGYTYLPVSGTQITQFSLYGSWTARMYVDGGASPVATEVFSITK